MFRAAGSGSAGALTGNGVRSQRPPLAAQFLGDGGVAPERADARIECLDDGLTDVPVWNQRQHVGSLTAFPFELAGQKSVVSLKNPAKKAQRAARLVRFRHAAV